MNLHRNSIYIIALYFCNFLKETVEFIQYFYPTWQINGNQIYILNEQKGPKSEQIPSMSLIANTLSYATELERIV